MKRLSFTLTLFALSACSSKKFRGPEGYSGPDQVMAGATPLAANATVKDVVGFEEGDQSDWHQLKGENTNLALTLLSSADKEMIVRVYRSYGRNRQLGAPRILQPRKEYRFNLKKDDLYVQVMAKRRSEGLEYSLIRRDLSKGGSAAKMGALAVIDLYPLPDARALVLLKVSDELKAGAMLAISGENDKQKLEDLGDCEITQVSNGQASCTLASQPKSKYGIYKATLL